MTQIFNKTFMAKASMMASANFVVFASIAIQLSLIGTLIGKEYAVAYGAVMSVAATLAILVTGIMIWQIAQIAPLHGKLKKAPETAKPQIIAQITEANNRVFAYTLAIAISLFVLWLVIVAFSHLIFAQPAILVMPLGLSILFDMLIGPFSAVLTGRMQLAQKESMVFGRNLLITSLSIGSVLLVAWVVKQNPDLIVYALPAIGIFKSLSYLVMTIMFYRKIGGFGTCFKQQKLTKYLREIRPSGLLKIVAGAIDGMVFSAVFAFAIAVSARHSVQDGFVVTLVVAVMRMIVVPSKQFGLVGGRFYASGAIDSVRTIVASSGLILTLGALVILPFYIWQHPGKFSTLLLVLMFAQILLEPFAGVIFGFLKVAAGPGSALWGMLATYLLLALPGLVLLGFWQIASAEIVWTLLFAARLVFTACTILSLRAFRHRCQVAG
ncbi:MAG: hypothetical protein Q4C71_03845 [Microbacteriaceae bacterium]|nr:hypothetical protein [Microbacteriaceae bacterium]